MDSHHNTHTFFFTLTQKTINISIFVAFRSPDKRTRALNGSESRRRKGRERARCNFLAVSSRTPEREREEEESLIDIFIIARLAEIHALARIKD